MPPVRTPELTRTARSPVEGQAAAKRSLVPHSRGVNLHNAMAVAAATAQAASDARGEAKAFAKENAGGFQPSSHGLTTLMLALFAIMTDITDDFVPALLLLNHVTTKIPLASILRNSRYLDIEMGAFHAGGGGATRGTAPPRAPARRGGRGGESRGAAGGRT